MCDIIDMNKNLTVERNVVTKSGKLLYSEPDNPYETVEVYLDTEHEFVIKRYESEHEPDGGQSWKVITIDEQNVEKLKKLVNGDIEEFLKVFFHRNFGMNGFIKFLKEHGITYDFKYYV